MHFLTYHYDISVLCNQNLALIGRLNHYIGDKKEYKQIWKFNFMKSSEVNGIMKKTAKSKNSVVEHFKPLGRECYVFPLRLGLHVEFA